MPLYRVLNPDEIEKRLESATGIDLGEFGVSCGNDELSSYLANTTYSAAVKKAARSMRIVDGQIFSRDGTRTSYNAAILTAFLRSQLIQNRVSFSYESVFSHPSKVEELRKAVARGYRVYLYFVSLADPDMCIGRIQERVLAGGHAVPDGKVRRRYADALQNLLPALDIAHRAYLFDNSQTQARLIAEKTPSGDLRLHREHVPAWIETYVLTQLD